MVKLITSTFIGQFSTKPYILRANCNTHSDCVGKNQGCFREPGAPERNFCGTKTCRTMEDCKDVGHVISGKNTAKKCKGGACKYNKKRIFA